MNSTSLHFSQAFLRIALGTAMISAVCDRLGYWGPYGGTNISWGDWQHFMLYANKLNFYAPAALQTFMAITATALEVVLGIQLVIGYKTRLASLATSLLMLSFALSMTVGVGGKAALNYSVWTSCAAAALLASVNSYKWSIDQLLNNRRTEYLAAA